MSADTDLRDALVECLADAFEAQANNESSVERWYSHIQLSGSFNIEIVANHLLKVIKDWTADEPSIPFPQNFTPDAESIRMRKLTDQL